MQVNEFKDLSQFFDERHQQAVLDFGDTPALDLSVFRVWRFQGAVMDTRDGRLVSDLALVYGNGDAILGTATLEARDGEVWATVTAKYDCPERLDFDTGRHFQLIPETKDLTVGGDIEIIRLLLVQAKEGQDNIF